MEQPPPESQAQVTPSCAMESVRWAEPALATGSVPEPLCRVSRPQRSEEQREAEGRMPWAGDGSARAVGDTGQLQAGPPLALHSPQHHQPAPCSSLLCPGALRSGNPNHGLVCPQLHRQGDPGAVPSQAAARKAELDFA